jgi:glycosyltransferase involved in cell wall biosynthesis
VVCATIRHRAIDAMPAAMTRFLLSFGAWAGGLSGGDRHLLEMAARWREVVEIEIVAPAGARSVYGPLIGDLPFRTARLGLGGGPNGARLAAEYVRRAAAAELTSWRTDVVIAASHFLPDAATVHSAVRRGAAGVAYVYHLVEGRSDRSLRSGWSKFDERLSLALLLRAGTLTFTSNSETESRLREVGFAPLRTDVGIDVASFSSSGQPGGEPLVAFIARLVPTKGLIDAIEAFALVRNRVPAARLVIVGRGPLREAAARRASELGVGDAVEWTGFVSEAEKRRILATARVLVAPSYEEGWGIAVAEALASGLPAIAYRLSNLDEVFGDAYIGVAVGDRDGLATELVRLLTDDRAAAEFGAQGRAAGARYDLDRVAEEELRLILRSIGR